MPLQNRVDPFGRLHASPARGLLMGNRGGRLHRDDRTLGARRSVTTRWICCALAFGGRRRAVWGAGYTELFFLDEATALAAGHRPCFECRRAAALAYRATAFPGAAPRAAGIDAILDRERRATRPRLDAAALAGLPDGAMVGAGGRAFLVRAGALRPWSFSGYGAPVAPPPEMVLLTPPTSVAALRRGYAAVLHRSAADADRAAPP